MTLDADLQPGTSARPKYLATITLDQKIICLEYTITHLHGKDGHARPIAKVWYYPQPNQTEIVPGQPLPVAVIPWKRSFMVYLNHTGRSKAERKITRCAYIMCRVS